jgi:signal transduction histidine kinase
MRLIFVLLLFCAIHCQAQVQKFVVERIDTEDGLSSSSIRGLELDSKNGFLWIATDAGLARFNGQSVETFQSNIYGNAIRDRIVFLGRKKDGSITGLGHNFFPFDIRDHKVILHPQNFIYRSSKEAFFYLNKGLKPPIVEQNVRMTVQDWEQFDVWGNSYLKNENSVYKMQSGKYLFAAAAPNSKAFVFNNRLVLVDKNLKCWELFPSGKLVFLCQIPLKNAKMPLSLFQEKANAPVYFVVNNLMYELKLTKNKVLPQLISNQVPNEEYIKYLVKDPLNKTFYLGTQNKGIIVLRPKYFEWITQKALNKTPEKSFYAQFEIPGKGILLNTGDILSPTKLTTKRFSFLKRIAFPNFFLSADSVLYTANADSILAHDLKKNKLKYGLINPSRNGCVFIEVNKTLYVFDFTGISHLENGKLVKDSNFSTQAPNFQVFEVKFLTKTQLLLATSDGLLRYDISKNKIHQVYRTPNNVPIRTILPYKGAYLLGTYGEGIYAYKKGLVKAIAIDPMNNLKFTHAFMPLNDGSMWISTNNGLFRVIGNELLRAFDQSNFQPNFQYFGKNEGLPVTEFNGGCIPAAITLKDGKLSFPTIDGLIQFSPTLVPRALRKINVFVDEIIVNDTLNINPQFKAKVFPSNSESVIFKLAIAGFLGQSPGSVSYSFDEPKNWQKLPPNVPLIKLTKPEDGDHLLYLRWQDPSNGKFYQRSFVFEVATPWYRTLLFMGLLGLLFVFAMFGLIKFRSYSLEQSRRRLAQEVETKTIALQEINEVLYKRNRIKDRIIAVLNHDLLTPLKYMHIAAGRMETQLENPLSKKSLKEIAQTSKSLELLTSNVLSWVKYSEIQELPPLETISLSQLVEKEILFLSPMFADRQDVVIQNQVLSSLKLITQPDLLRVILYNLLLNAYRATTKGGIQVTASLLKQEGFWAIRVADTGLGMSAEQIQKILDGQAETFDTKKEADHLPKGNGVGYAIIQDLLRLLAAKVQIDSTPNHGTTVTILLPFYP